jgi:hypothetical protein
MAYIPGISNASKQGSQLYPTATVKSKVIGVLRKYFNLPFYESATQAGASNSNNPAEPILSGTTTLAACGVDSNQKKVKLLEVLATEMGLSASGFNFADLGQLTTATSTEVTQTGNPIGTLITINDVVNYFNQYV